jgi:hypothetical protein
MKAVYLIFLTVCWDLEKRGKIREKGLCKWSVRVTSVSREEVFSSKIICVGFYKLKRFLACHTKNFKKSYTVIKGSLLGFI